jgi:hypothetical protein
MASLLWEKEMLKEKRGVLRLNLGFMVQLMDVEETSPTLEQPPKIAAASQAAPLQEASLAAAAMVSREFGFHVNSAHPFGWIGCRSRTCRPRISGRVGMIGPAAFFLLPEFLSFFIILIHLFRSFFFLFFLFSFFLFIFWRG